MFHCVSGSKCYTNDILALVKVKAIPHEGVKVVSPTHQPPLPPGNIPGTHFC